VLLGVGNTLRADDGVGPWVAQELRGRVAAEVLDVGDMPENFIGPILKAEPDVVVLVDAADFGAEPGEIRVVPGCEVDGLALGTHAMPLGMFMQIISKETGAEARLVAIQVESTELGGSMTNAVASAADTLAKELMKILGS
jgi:hydrogenase 3 maturation protease